MKEKLKNNKNKLNKIIFSKFVKENFDFSCCEIKRKYIHSLKVANICLKLSKKLGLNKNLSYAIGLLHDYARFLQFTEYKTFSDFTSFDHGEMACKLLFEENQIANFDIEQSLYPVLYVAIYLHNKKDVDLKFIKNYLEGHPCPMPFEEVLKYVHLIRDADKIDILRVIIEKNFQIDNTLNGITPSLKKEIQSYKSPTIKNSKTKLDTMVIQLSFLYNLYFKESQKFITLNKFLKVYLSKYLKTLNSTDQAFLLKHIEDIKEFLIKK